MKAFNDREYLVQSTWGEELEKWANSYKNNVAIIEGAHKVTYKDLNEKVNTLAFGFLEMGLKKGDKAVVQLPNRSSFIYTVFALFRIGVIPVLVRPSHREADLKHIFEKSEPALFVTTEKFQGYKYENMADSLYNAYNFLKHVVIDGKTEKYRALKDVKGSSIKINTPEYNDMALITLSGGTTGVPKLIPRSHGDYIYNVKKASKRSQVTFETVFLAALPISHGFAFANPGILGTLSKGGKVVLCANASPDEILPLIEKERVTMTALVPTAAQFCLETLEWDKENDISSLQAVLIGGSVLEESLARRIVEEMNCQLQQVFGMSEGLICMTDMVDTKEVVVTCQGKPISEFDEIQIVDESFRQVANGEFGELVTRGPYTIHGYYKAPEANRESFTPDGYYRTGDRAKIRPDGNVVVTGRMKDRINRGGEKITPSEVEGYLCSHPSVKQSVVVGLPDEILGQSICAFIVSESEELDLTSLRSYLLSQGVSSYKCPDVVISVSEFPLTAVGKINRKALVELAVKS